MGGSNTKKGVKAVKDSDYLTSDIKIAFNHLRYAFTQALILQHFDLKRYIRITTNALGYDISKVLYKLILDHLGQ